MRPLKTLTLAAGLILTSGFTASAEIKVVTSIKPVHALVSGVMEGVGTPGLIMEGGESPHTYALKPSKARMLQSADVVFRIGEGLEAFLNNPLASLAKNAKRIDLMDAHGIRKLEFREGVTFEGHDHDEHNDHKESAEKHGHDEKHAREEEHGYEEKHAHKDEQRHDDHDHGSHDPHIWLDPLNAKALVHEIEEVLAEADPENAKTYKANAKSLSARLDALVAEVEQELAPVKGKHFVVFHDAYHYFEARFDIEASGTITVSPEVIPGAARVAEIRDTVKKMGVSCVFAEPQFEPKLIATVLEGSGAKSGVLDPLGATFENGSELYFDLIRSMANSFKTCLSGMS